MSQPSRLVQPLLQGTSVRPIQTMLCVTPVATGHINVMNVMQQNNNIKKNKATTIDIIKVS